MANHKQNFKEDEVRGAVDLLRQKVRKLGAGAVTEKMDLGINYFSQARQRGTMDFGAILETLEIVAEEPGDFFRELYPRGLDRPEGSAASAMPFASENPKLVPELVALIEEADELRYEDCEAAIARLYARASEVPFTLGARFLAVCGSSLRMAGDLPDAELCLAAALKIAPTLDVQANVFQRFSSVLLNQGDLDKALEVAEKAGEIYLSIGDEAGYGQALVDQGGVLWHAGEEAEAACRMALALKHAKVSDVRHLCTIHQHLAVSEHNRGNSTLAWQHLKDAYQCAPSKNFLAGVHGTAAMLRERGGHYQDAANSYHEAFRLLESPLDRLICLAHTVHALAKAGALRQAAEMGKVAHQLMGAVSSSKVAVAAVTGLFRLQAESCVADVEEIISSLSGLRSGPGTSLGDRALRARERAGLDRRSAAVQMGVPEASLMSIEGGKTPGHKYANALEAWISNQSPASRLALYATS